MSTGSTTRSSACSTYDPNWNHLKSLNDLSSILREEIEQFFSIYKQIERKRVVVGGWHSKTDARKEIRAAQARLKAQ